MSKSKKPAGDANEHYNKGIGIMRQIEAPLREGALNPAQKKAAGEAESELRTAIEIASNHGRAHIMLGMLLRFLKRGKEAIEHLETGLELPPESADWMIASDTLSGVYMDLEQYDAAAKNAKAATKHHPDDPLGWWKLGASLYESKKYKESRKVLEDGLGHCPGHAGLAGSLAEVMAILEPPKEQEIPKEYADKAKQIEVWSQELNDAYTKVLEGAGSQDAKTKKLAAMQAEFQEKVKKLYGG